MGTLEEALREAAAKGLTHVTMWPVPAQDRNHMFWYARATPSTGHSYVQTHALDPVEALLEVLKALPNAKRRKTEKSPLLAMAQEARLNAVEANAGLTATVTETPPQPETMETWLPKT